ncbi:MAG: apolipoprotein N-acyltransferase [Micrococcales bacterium]|nr:apolipoprotein N-acyltransferase [Micrococcales bacterium]
MRRKTRPAIKGTTWAWSVALAAAGGLALFLAFPPFDLWFLAPLAMAALYGALERMTPWRGYASAWLMAAVWFTPLFWWAHAAAGTLPWLALSWASAALFALVAPSWGYARRLLAKNGWLSPLVFATLVAGFDSIRSFWPFGGFPWGRLAFSQAPGPLGRWSWLAGAPFVSFAVALAGAFLWAGLSQVQAKRWSFVTGATASAIAIALVPLALPLGEGAQDGQLMVGAVQGNVAVTDQGLFAQRREVLDNHVAGTYALAQQGHQLDLVLWPENATDIDPLTDATVADDINQAAAAIGAPILLGAMEYVGQANRYNLALLWQPGQGIVGKYAKRHPAPFAEYMPGRGFFRHFTGKVDLISTDMLAGQSIGLFTLPVMRLDRDVLVGDVICFEVAYDSLVADTIKAGAEILVVQTNNASFGRTSESLQQLAMSRLRAIEHGRTTVQVSTVGVSAVISPTGKVSHQTSLFAPAEFVAALPLRHTATPAQNLAMPFVWILLLASAGLTLAGLTVAVARRR